MNFNLAEMRIRAFDEESPGKRSHRQDQSGSTTRQGQLSSRNAYSAVEESQAPKESIIIAERDDEEPLLSKLQCLALANTGLATIIGLEDGYFK